jgi:uncharacterized surface protein with fasciclin (FAS1) repeats
MRFSWSKFNVKKHFVALALAVGLNSALAADIVDTMSQTTSFRIFCAALKTSGIAATLKNTGPYTVFAPSDAAFAKFPREKWEALKKNKTLLADVVAHHVVPGKIIVADAKPGDVSTLDGVPLHMESDNGMVSVDDAKVTQSDILADNGVIHEIDTLILPPGEQ